MQPPRFAPPAQWDIPLRALDRLEQALAAYVQQIIMVIIAFPTPADVGLAVPATTRRQEQPLRRRTLAAHALKDTVAMPALLRM